MGLTTATLSGQRVTHAEALIPKWGCWYADAALDGEHTLSGAVDLVIADLTLKGTILAGGPDKGRSFYRIVAGKGGWGRVIPKQSYRSDAGVRKSNVLTDAAKAVGETMAPIPLTEVLGPAFTRPAGQASRVLELVAPSAWYVGEDGVTRLGARARTELTTNVTRGATDLSQGRIEIASDSIAQLLPGVVVAGVEALDVRHTIDAGKLRTIVYGKSIANARMEAARTSFELLFPWLRFAGAWEYRVVTREGKRVNLQPTQVSTGMPDLRRVHIRPGVAGVELELELGSKVLVAFANCDPTRPYVCAFEDPEGEGFVPAKTTIDADEIKLGASALLGVAMQTSPVVCGPFAGSVTQGSATVKVKP